MWPLPQAYAIQPRIQLDSSSQAVKALIANGREQTRRKNFSATMRNLSSPCVSLSAIPTFQSATRPRRSIDSVTGTSSVSELAMRSLMSREAPAISTSVSGSRNWVFHPDTALDGLVVLDNKSRVHGGLRRVPDRVHRHLVCSIARGDSGTFTRGGTCASEKNGREKSEEDAVA
jgi:hypothetical protein